MSPEVLLKLGVPCCRFLALERGFPAIVSPFGTRRLHFPSGTFDTILCGECQIPGQSNGGKLLIEMNRILRPAGYLILSSKHDSIEDDEAMSKLTTSLGWNILAHKTDDVSVIGVRIYQKPESNEIYALRRKKVPPICKDNENADVAWIQDNQFTNQLHAVTNIIKEDTEKHILNLFFHCWPHNYFLDVYTYALSFRFHVITPDSSFSV